MWDYIPTASKVLTSPIWFLAIAIFGTIYYFQFVIGKIGEAPKNIPCEKCGDKQHRHFPNTKFCDDCFHDLRDEMNGLTAELEAARKIVAESGDEKAKLAAYEKAIETCKALLAMKEKYPKHGLSMSDNLPTVLEYAVSEHAELQTKMGQA